MQRTMQLTEALPPDRRARVDARLATNVIAWLTTVDAHCRPASVPVWFLRRPDDTILLYSRAGQAKLRNIELHPYVALGLDVTDLGRDIIRIDGMARHQPDHPPAHAVPEYAAKYAERVAAIFGTIEAFGAAFTEPIVITPTRLHA